MIRITSASGGPNHGEVFCTFMKLGGFMTTPLFYPKPYVDIQIRPAIKDNDRSAEVVWIYLYMTTLLIAHSRRKTSLG